MFACAEQGKTVFLQLKSGKGKSRGAAKKNSVSKSTVWNFQSHIFAAKDISVMLLACLEGLFTLQDTT